MRMLVGHYKSTPKCEKCGCSTKWFIAKDKKRVNRARTICRCDAYHYPHRRNSKLCRPGAEEQIRLEWEKEQRDLRDI